MYLANQLIDENIDLNLANAILLKMKSKSVSADYLLSVEDTMENSFNLNLIDAIRGLEDIRPRLLDIFISEIDGISFRIFSPPIHADDTVHSFIEFLESTLQPAFNSIVNLGGNLSIFSNNSFNIKIIPGFKDFSFTNGEIRLANAIALDTKNTQFYYETNDALISSLTESFIHESTHLVDYSPKQYRGLLDEILALPEAVSRYSSRYKEEYESKKLNFLTGIHAKLNTKEELKTELENLRTDVRLYFAEELAEAMRRVFNEFLPETQKNGAQAASQFFDEHSKRWNEKTKIVAVHILRDIFGIDQIGDYNLLTMAPYAGNMKAITALRSYWKEAGDTNTPNDSNLNQRRVNTLVKESKGQNIKSK